MNGPSAQLLVTRGLKSGLELAVEDLAHVWESAQRQKIARRQSVQVVSSALFHLLSHLISGPVKPSRWQKWGPWSHCSTTCDKGHRVRARACTGSHGSCPGKPTKTKDCLGDKCPGCLFQTCILFPHSPCLLVLIVSTCLILSVTSLCFFTCLYDH